MSATLMGASLYLPIEKPEKLLLIAMADNANEPDGLGVYPGNHLLALKSSDSKRNMQKVLNRLVELELIARHRHPFGGRGLSVEWALNADLIYTLARANGWTQKRVPLATPFTKQKGGITAQKGGITAQKGAPGDTPTLRTVITSDPEPSMADKNPRRNGEKLPQYLTRLAQLYEQAGDPR